MNRSYVLVACALMLSVGAASAQTTTAVATSRSADGLITDPLASPSNTSNVSADVAGNKKVTVIYDNFNDDPTNLYGTSYAWNVSGSQSNWGSHAMAAAFTPLVDTQVTKIKVAVGSHTSAREVLISLHSDDNRLPGRSLKYHTVDAPDGLNCCEVAKIYMKGITLKAGTQYWVVVSAPKNNQAFAGAWSWNNTRVTGLMAVKQNGSGWMSYISTTGAFSVISE